MLEADEVLEPVAPDTHFHPFGERVDDGGADAVQAAGDLVAVLVELAAGVQLGQRDLGGTALGLVLVVHLHAGGNAAAVIDDGDRVVAVDGDDDVVAMAGQRLVDRVVDHLEHQVVQARAVGRVADVHARALAHRFQALEDLDAAFTVGSAGRCVVALLLRGLRDVAHELLLEGPSGPGRQSGQNPPLGGGLGGAHGTAKRIAAVQAARSASASRRT